MTVTEYAIPAFVVLLAIFGIVDMIRTPYIVRRFYQGKSFTDKGKASLEEVTDSNLVLEMYANHVYQKVENGIAIRQFQAWSINRRKFTLSKAARKRNQTAWSITVIDAVEPIAVCTILPTVVPEAIVYITDGRNIDIAEDAQIATRYHVVTEQENIIVPLITQKIRQFLLQSEVVSIECTSKQVVLKRHWAAHQVLDRLQTELDVCQVIHDSVLLGKDETVT